MNARDHRILTSPELSELLDIMDRYPDELGLFVEQHGAKFTRYLHTLARHVDYDARIVRLLEYIVDLLDARSWCLLMCNKTPPVQQFIGAHRRQMTLTVLNTAGTVGRGDAGQSRHPYV